MQMPIETDQQFLPMETVMPLLNPKYPPQYYEKFTQLKKLMNSKMFSKKANELAQWLIPHGQSNYNCWYVKKMCFLNNVVTYEHQMRFSEDTIMQKVKSFQLWEHRRFLAQHSGNFRQQYDLINKALNKQYKNYHAWSHRIWVVDNVKNYEQQLTYTRKQLQKDPYNNSVWSYRFHLMNKTLPFIQSQEQKQQVAKQQFKRVLANLKINLADEACWNYLRGFFPSIKLVSQYPSSNKYAKTIFDSFDKFPQILQFIKAQIQNIQNKSKKIQNVNEKLLVAAEIQCLISLVCIESQTKETKEYSRNTCQLLALKEPQKANYWKWISQNIA